ncbi:MAG TPA: hypothetical protein VJ742_11985 [Nitrososphaera sp.]|nr:hypothetical protein [Nitrososphaera sp.]
MVPDETDQYMDGEVTFTIHHFTNPYMFNKYWISAGVASLEFDEDGIVSLKTMLDDYFGTDDEEPSGIKILSGFFIGVVLTVLLMVVFGAGV